MGKVDDSGSESHLKTGLLFWLLWAGGLGRAGRRGGCLGGVLGGLGWGLGVEGGGCLSEFFWGCGMDGRATLYFYLGVFFSCAVKRVSIEFEGSNHQGFLRGLWKSICTGTEIWDGKSSRKAI